MSKPNVTRVQSATERTASVHTLHMSKPNVTRVQSATERTASVHTLHMSKPNVTRVQSATQWTASVHSLHMSKPNVTRVQSATERTASVHTLHMSKPNVTRVQSATQWTASVLLRTAKCYSTTTLYYKVLLRYYSSTTPYYKVLFRTAKCYPTTTPVLLCTTKYYSCFALQTKTINQPASQPVWPAGRRTRCWPASRATWKRPAGRLARLPAGRPADEIANKSTVLSSFWKGLPNDLPEKLLRTNYKVLHSLLLCTAKYNTVLHAQYYSVLCSTTPYYLALFRKTKY